MWDIPAVEKKILAKMPLTLQEMALPKLESKTPVMPDKVHLAYLLSSLLKIIEKYTSQIV